MPPPTISSTRLAPAAGAAAGWRGACGDGGVKFSRHRAAGFFGGGAQDGAHFVFDRTAALGRAQPQQLLQSLVELPDGEGGHNEIHNDFSVLEGI